MCGQASLVKDYDNLLVDYLQTKVKIPSKRGFCCGLFSLILDINSVLYHARES